MVKSEITFSYPTELQSLGSLGSKPLSHLPAPAGSAGFFLPRRREGVEGIGFHPQPRPGDSPPRALLCHLTSEPPASHQAGECPAQAGLPAPSLERGHLATASPIPKPVRLKGDRPPLPPGDPRPARAPLGRPGLGRRRAQPSASPGHPRPRPRRQPVPGPAPAQVARAEKGHLPDTPSPRLAPRSVGLKVAIAKVPRLILGLISD